MNPIGVCITENLPVKKFMQFNPGAFNIYYAILISGLSAFGSYTSYKYIAPTFTSPQTEITEPVKTSSNTKNDTVSAKRNFVFTDTANVLMLYI
jgi:hypothetical protein